jgi:hypothetical protein
MHVIRSNQIQLIIALELMGAQDDRSNSEYFGS